MYAPGSLKGKQIDQFRWRSSSARGPWGWFSKATDNILNRTVALKLISKKVEFTTRPWPKPADG